MIIHNQLFKLGLFIIFSNVKADVVNDNRILEDGDWESNHDGHRRVDDVSNVISLFQSNVINITNEISLPADHVSTIWDETMRTFGKLIKETFTGEILGNVLENLPEANISDACRRSMNEYLKGIEQFSPWAIQMADATAKIPPGILDGTLVNFGAFDECLTARSGQFMGQYCLVGYTSPLISTTKRDALAPYTEKYGPPPDWMKYYLNERFALTENSTLWFASCLPSTCLVEDIRTMHKIKSDSGPVVKVMECQVDEPRKLASFKIYAIIFLLVLTLLCLIATLYDIRNPQSLDKEDLKKESVASHILRTFSIARRTRLLVAECSRRSPLNCLHGIRLIPCLFITTGHTYMYPDLYRFTRYSRFVRGDGYIIGYEKLFFENVVITVNAFFFISGFLLLYTTWRKLERNGRINVFRFVIHRAMRVIPSLLFGVLLLYILPIFTRGPLWNSGWDHFAKNCEKHLWRNLLFFSNFYDVDLQCLPHTWFLSCQMQCHIAALFILLITFKWRKTGFVLGVLLTAGVCYWKFYTCMTLNIAAPATFRINDFQYTKYFMNMMYFKFHSYVGCYLSGMLTAYAVLKYNHIKLSKAQQAFGWIFSVVTMYGSYWGILWVGDYGVLPSLYNALYHTVFAMGLTWVVYACTTGIGGVVNTVLSAPPVIFLNNLGFLLYLLHPMVYYIKAAAVKERIYYGHVEHAYDAMATLLLSLFISYIGYVMVEAPFNELDMMLIGSEVSGQIFAPKPEPEPSSGKKSE